MTVSSSEREACKAWFVTNFLSRDSRPLTETETVETDIEMGTCTLEAINFSDTIKLLGKIANWGYPHPSEQKWL